MTYKPMLGVCGHNQKDTAWLDAYNFSVKPTIDDIEDDWGAFEQIEQTYNAVDNPAHYCSHPSGVEVIQITEHESFCVGNAIKYLLRHAKKNGKQDLEKALWYVKREIARVYEDE